MNNLIQAVEALLLPDDPVRVAVVLARTIQLLRLHEVDQSSEATVERVAFALWRNESLRAANRPRTLEQWADESPETHEHWKRAARVAISSTKEKQP